MPPRFVPLSDVADLLSISASQAYALVRSGELRAIKVGGRGQWRVEVSEIESYIERGYAATALALEAERDTTAAHGTAADGAVSDGAVMDGAVTDAGSVQDARTSGGPAYEAGQRAPGHGGRGSTRHHRGLHDLEGLRALS